MGLIQLEPGELDLDLTLQPGQCFSWDLLDDDAASDPPASHDAPGRSWRAVLPPGASTPGAGVLVTLQQRGAGLWYDAACATDGADVDGLVRSYLRLDDSAAALYGRWAEASRGSALGAEFARVSPAAPGLRLLRQPPAECLVSFICSQNNNVARIASMVRALRSAYGRPLPGALS
eukprot:m51a1_g8996 putative n-glycosylase dna lyase (176) ;mRNA; f:98611-99138